MAGQIRAARALLNWSQHDLAEASGVGSATIKRIERLTGQIKGNVTTQMRIRQAIEKAGIRFIENDEEAGIGVRLEHLRKKRRIKAKS